MAEEFGNHKVPTYIAGLDEEMQGGIPEGHVILVAGTAGTMKSSITFNILYNEALRGKVGLYLTLEQSYRSLLKHIINMGLDLRQANIVILDDIGKISETLARIKPGTGAIIITDVGAIRKQIKVLSDKPNGDWLNMIKNILKKIRENTDLSLFVLDSLSALYVLSDFKDARTQLFYLFEFFRDLAITSYLISEMPLAGTKYGELEIEDFLADGIIHVELSPRMRKVDRNIHIVKMRGTKVNTDVFTLEYKNGKFSALYGGKTPLV